MRPHLLSPPAVEPASRASRSASAKGFPSRLALAKARKVAGDEGLVDHPGDAAKLTDVVRIVGGAALFLAGNFIIKRIICGRFITSHGTGIAALAVLAAVAVGWPLHLVNVGVAAILVAVAIWEELAIRARRQRQDLDASAGAEEKISMVEA